MVFQPTDFKPAYVNKLTQDNRIKILTWQAYFTAEDAKLHKGIVLKIKNMGK